MRMYDILSINSIRSNVKSANKKQLLQDIANIASEQIGIPSMNIARSLQQREILGPTGMGNGIAIPHTKINGINKTQVIFLKLKNGVDFSASDGVKIDLVFSIIAPENSESDHLLILSSISNFIRKKQKVERLRGSTTIDEILFLFSKI